MEEIVIGILLISFLYWYFNIQRDNTCIKLTSNCNN
jgi:hypothetical protein